MSIYKYQCKRSRNATWHDLSVSTKHPMEEGEMWSYAQAFAAKHGWLLIGGVDIRCINASGNEVVKYTLKVS